MTAAAPTLDSRALADAIRHWALELGFTETGITDTDLSDAARGLHLIAEHLP